MHPARLPSLINHQRFHSFCPGTPLPSLLHPPRIITKLHYLTPYLERLSGTHSNLASAPCCLLHLVDLAPPASQGLETTNRSPVHLTVIGVQFTYPGIAAALS
ncbi:hypothetical protein N656DRAFT_344482 [Canariomyces notabilis]|uniref:Uncharacterized protein n=1 Tax=Canariomyces notabilis TaxID=2074819 RepID=A0AAN6QG21_9PEZI|nr:hypothetical protein N656DRAFT_344482 [Canariomyces arenarius]